MKYVVSLSVGLPLGYLWTLAVALFWGPWWGAMSLPALFCWMIGSFSGVLGGLIAAAQSSFLSKVANTVILVVLAAGAIFANEPLGIRLSEDQTLNVLFLKWEPSNEPLTVDSERPEPLSPNAISLLHLAQIRGHVRVMWGGSVHGRGPTGTALILLRSPIYKPVSVRQPDRSLALYVQEAAGFKTYPPNVKTLDRTIELSGGGAGVWYSVTIAQGGKQSGPAFEW